jgi:hypothetical protein
MQPSLGAYRNGWLESGSSGGRIGRYEVPVQGATSFS